MLAKIKKELYQFGVLLKSVPAIITTIFVVTVVVMNLLANKSIDLHVDWLALDCGTLISWVAFLTMDIVTKHYGPKASTQLSLFATGANLAVCLILFIASVIPGVWSESFASDGSVIDIVNSSLDKTIGGTWYVVMGSTVAFIISAVVNNFTNWGIGKLFKKRGNGATAFLIRSCVSTAIGQFVDNFTFALIVGHFFFGWSYLQCATCALTGMVVELVLEGVFFPVAFRICKKWQRDEVGKQYFDCLKEV